MASKISSDTLKSFCECPVCFEPFKDPRLLVCGHQFCEGCLKDIIAHNPKQQLPCPTCRVVTTPLLGDVRKLPRSTLHQYIQELIFQQPTKEALGKVCTKCKINKPTQHCTECKPELSYLCDGCYTTHQKLPRFAKHKTVQFDPLLVCSEHPHRMVECFCHGCCQVVCEECLFESHSEHNIEDLDAAAEKSRKVVQVYMKQQDERRINRDIIVRTKSPQDTLQNNKKSIVEMVEKTKKAIRKLESSLNQIVDSVTKEVDTEAQKLDKIQEEISSVCTAQEKMLKLAESLLGDVSDPQLIMGARDLPKPDLDITDVKVNIPTVDEKFGKMAAAIEKMAKSADISYKQEVCKIYRGIRGAPWQLKKMKDITLSNGTRGVKFVWSGPTMFVRVEDKDAPVQVFTADGELKRKLGAGTKAYDRDGYTQLGYDTRRGLILLPCVDGSLVRMETAGWIRDTTQLGEELGDVAYLPEQDMYVASDMSTRHISLVSADTLAVVRSWGDKKTHKCPLHLCVGTINNNTTIVVSDYGRNTLFLYSTEGTLIRTYGPPTQDIGRFNEQCGVAVDGSGRLVVCDVDNSRVLRVWSDQAGDHWECLLREEQLGGQPWCVALDTGRRTMAVSVPDTKTVQLYNF